MKTLSDYKLSGCAFSSAEHTEFFAEDAVSQTPVRLLRFSLDVSADEVFRERFRRDIDILCSIHHFNVQAAVDWGESNGEFFCVYESPEGTSLLDGPQLKLTWDQLTDVAWQLASGLQHAHNITLTHGQIQPDCVFISPELRVQIGRFGPARWLDQSTDHRADEVLCREADVRQFGTLLQSLLNDHTQPSDESQLSELRKIVSATNMSPLRLTARDIQRRLGDLLLKDTAEELQMIDEREGQTLNRRSLVDELFDEVTLPTQPLAETQKERFWASIAIEIVSIAVLLALLLVGIWLTLS